MNNIDKIREWAKDQASIAAGEAMSKGNAFGKAKSEAREQAMYDLLALLDGLGEDCSRGLLSEAEWLLEGAGNISEMDDEEFSGECFDLMHRISDFLESPPTNKE